MTIYVSDMWLWSKIRIAEVNCKECGSEESITINKKDILKLIKILKKLNYEGIPKKGKHEEDKYFLEKESKE